MEEKSGLLQTKDKISLAYEHGQKGSRELVIICPGFFNSKSNRWMQKAKQLLSTRYDTLIFDFRGHGQSQGKFTWLAREWRDLEAVLDYAAACGYAVLGILGFSLGAAAAVNTLSRRKVPCSLVLISCPYSFWQINYHFWEPEMFSDLIDNIECDWEGKGARVDTMLFPKRKPINEIAKIEDTPILFIHGGRDWIIKDYHSRKLYEQARSPKKIEIIKDGLHAERLFQQYPERMKDLVFDWFANTLTPSLLPGG